MQSRQVITHGPGVMAVSATTSDAPVVTGADVARAGRRPLPATLVGGTGYTPAAEGPRPALHRAYLTRPLRLHGGTRHRVEAWQTPLAVAASSWRVPPVLT